MAGNVYSPDQRSELVGSLGDDARDFRRDLIMLERVDKDAGRDRVIVGTVQQAKEGRARHATEHPAVPNLEMIANG
jgi:hypothetical protein